ncbi:MAG: diacylglycerol kinase family protein [Bacteroidales bacterium]
MTTENKRQILFIINPISGIGKQKRIEVYAEELIDKSKFDFDFAYTQYPGHATTIAQNASKKNIDIVVIVGGDGSLNETMKGLLGSKTALGIVPCGSGNGFARHLNIPLNPREAIKQINTSKSISVDTVSLNDKTFISIAGIGYDAYVAKKFSNTKHRGFLGYTQVVVKSFLQYKDQDYLIKLDNKEEISTRAFFITFANSNQFGYNTIIAPMASLTDGKIDICIVKKPKFTQIPKMMRLLFTGKLNRSENVKYYQANSAYICTQNNETFVNIDGESQSTTNKINIQVHPSSINVVVPQT